MPAVITTRKPTKFGRPPQIKRQVSELLKDVMIKAVKPRFQEMINAQLDAAIGITTEKMNRNTGELHYSEEGPNPQAAKLIMDYVLEKPTQKLLHKGTVGLVHLVAQLELEDGDNDQEN